VCNIIYYINKKFPGLHITQYTNSRKYIMHNIQTQGNIHNIQTQGNILYTIYKPKEIYYT